MVVPDQVENGMHERPAPRLAHHLGTQDDVAELPGHAIGKLVTSIDRKCERVCFLVDPEVVTLQGADLLR